jgi:hypothetical protein
MIRIMIDSRAPKCHFDRRPATLPLSSRPEAEEFALSEVEWATMERSGCEPGVSGACIEVRRPDGKPFRPEGRFANAAT